MSPTDICVIYNPCAGRGSGSNGLKRLRRILGKRADFRATQAPDHGVELAYEAALEGFPVIAAAGGDGTVHEVANGLMQADRPETILAVVPLGSANDYAYSLELAKEWWVNPHPQIGPRLVDVGVIRAESRQSYFFNGMGLGFNGNVTREARKIKRIKGLLLYALAIFRTLRGHWHAPMVTFTTDETTQQLPTFALTIGIGQREGNFLMTPNAVLDDGLFDYLHVGEITRWRLIRYVPRVVFGKLPLHDPTLNAGRAKRVTLQSNEPLLIHTDGEFFCQPEEDIHRVDIELLPKKLRVFGRLKT